MKAILEVVDINIKDVVTESDELCENQTPQVCDVNF